jgi:hypothetical protein
MMDRIRYHVDNLFAKGTATLLVLLGCSVIFLLAVLTAVMLATGISVGPDADVFDVVWTLFTYTFDPSGVPYSEGAWPYRIIMLLASLGGVFILSLLVGILSNGFADFIETLRKGKSIVVEQGHVLILGWGDQIFSVVQELVHANSNVDRACIVILADMDKVEMEDALRTRVNNYANVRIVCRSGSPIDISDLNITRPTHARSIIILDHPNAGEEGDALTIKILLALEQLHDHQPLTSVVATMRQEENVAVANLITRGQASIVPSEIMVSQIITQTCRQPGLSMVYAELLDFDGDELYIKHEPNLVGRTFAEAQLAYETSTIVGLKFSDGRLKLNPPANTVLNDRDSVIALSADDDTIILRPSHMPAPPVQQDLFSPSDVARPLPENILVLGWNERGRFIIKELQEYVHPGTTICIVDHIDRSSDVRALQAITDRYTLSHRIGRTTARTMLDSLDLCSFSSVIVLADTSVSIQQADAKTLMTLVHIRDIISKGASAHVVNIVTEMLDERNRSLATEDNTNDFIISNTIVSLLLTQIAENRDLHAVFRDLFDAAGSELYLKPAEDYVQLDAAVTMATVCASASRKNEVAVGYKVLNNGRWDVALNRPKSETMTFSRGDSIVVVAED